jgi:hypothetical protein
MVDGNAVVKLAAALNVAATHEAAQRLTLACCRSSSTTRHSTEIHSFLSIICILLTSRVRVHVRMMQSLRATRTCSQKVWNQCTTTTNFLQIRYIYIFAQWHDRVNYPLHVKAQKNTAYRYHGTCSRFFSANTAETAQLCLLSTRRHAFASSSHQRTQPTWACCEERERPRLALSIPSPALGTRYPVAERHPEGPRLSAEE